MAFATTGAELLRSRRKVLRLFFNMENWFHFSADTQDKRFCRSQVSRQGEREDAAVEGHQKQQVVIDCNRHSSSSSSSSFCYPYPLLCLVRVFLFSFLFVSVLLLVSLADGTDLFGCSMISRHRCRFSRRSRGFFAYGRLVLNPMQRGF